MPQRFDPDTYVSVAERIDKFWQKFPNGRVTTEVIERADKYVVIKATVWRDTKETEPSSTGHARRDHAEGDAVEKAETSAFGRALALLGFETKKGIASREDMQEFERHGKSGTQATPTVSPAPQKPTEDPKPENCGYCSADLTISPTSNWLAAKRAKDPNFPPVCPSCFRKNTKPPEYLVSAGAP